MMMMMPAGAPGKISVVCLIHFDKLSHYRINIPLSTNPSLTKSK